MKTLNESECIEFLIQNYLKTVLISSTKTKFILNFKDLSKIDFDLTNCYVLFDSKSVLGIDTNLNCLGLYCLDFNLDLLNYTAKLEGKKLKKNPESLPKDLVPFYPLSELKCLQERLVSSVWYDGRGCDFKGILTDSNLGNFSFNLGKTIITIQIIL